MNLHPLSMKFSILCSSIALIVLLLPVQAVAGNPDPNNEFMKEYGRYRSYTGNRPTHRGITKATKDYREWLGNGWRDFSSHLQRDAMIRRQQRITEKSITAPFTKRERYRLRRVYRAKSTRRH